MTLPIASGLLTLGGASGPGYSPRPSPSAAQVTNIDSVPAAVADSSIPSVEELQQMLAQQCMALDNLFMSLGNSQSTTGLGGLFDTPAIGSGLAPADPKGAAIDMLLGSTGSGGGVGDIFNLALGANGSGLELAMLGLTDADTAEEAYVQATLLTQMMENVQQSNLNTLLNIGGGVSAAGLDRFI